MMTEREARAKLDSWRLWISIAFAGIAILTIGMIYLVSAKFSQDADRRAQQKVANATQVVTCITAARSAPNVLRLLDLLGVLARNSIIANQAALKTDPKGPLSKVRKDSLRRLRPSLSTISVFRKATIKSRRTIAECRALATKLGVDIAPLLKEGPT